MVTREEEVDNIDYVCRSLEIVEVEK